MNRGNNDHVVVCDDIQQIIILMLPMVRCESIRCYATVYHVTYRLDIFAKACGYAIARSRYRWFIISWCSVLLPLHWTAYDSQVPFKQIRNLKDPWLLKHQLTTTKRWAHCLINITVMCCMHSYKCQTWTNWSVNINLATDRAKL